MEQDARAEVELVNEWLWFREYGAAPVAGGRLDQSPIFIEAGTIIEDEIAIVARVKNGSGQQPNNHGAGR